MHRESGTHSIGKALKKRCAFCFPQGWRIVSVPWWEWESLATQGRGAHVRYLARETRGGSGAGGDARREA
jgi:hypothetical protein